MAEKVRLETDEILRQLFSEPSLEHWMTSEASGVSFPSFSEYITALCTRRGEPSERVINRANIEKSYGHHLFTGRRNPSRDTVLLLAFGFELDYAGTQELLKAARKIALDLIDRDEALNKRAAELFTEGMNKGFREASWRTLRCCMAGACLMMQEAFGLPDDEIIRGLKIMYDKTSWALEYSDMVDEVMEKTGILLQLDDPLDPIQQIREKTATG